MILLNFLNGFGVLVFGVVNLLFSGIFFVFIGLDLLMLILVDFLIFLKLIVLILCFWLGIMGGFMCLIRVYCVVWKKLWVLMLDVFVLVLR